MDSQSFPCRLSIAALLLALVAGSGASDQSNRVPVLDAKSRKTAPAFVLKDASGETARLNNYRGKVLVLDFWATWCTGCKKEIPWFSEFQRNYGAKGFAVVGVAMDEEGWKVVKPFLAETRVPYRMLLGDQATADHYGIKSLPDTFLIDRRGRIAVAYRARLVDKQELEASIQTVLAER
jgi:cytochrome c biogenesis protein CcmG/thiol:disulfide interchange protein DsbE